MSSCKMDMFLHIWHFRTRDFCKSGAGRTITKFDANFILSSRNRLFCRQQAPWPRRSSSWLLRMHVTNYVFHCLLHDSLLATPGTERVGGSYHGVALSIIYVSCSRYCARRVGFTRLKAGGIGGWQKAQVNFSWPRVMVWLQILESCLIVQVALHNSKITVWWLSGRSFRFCRYLGKHIKWIQFNREGLFLLTSSDNEREGRCNKKRFQSICLDLGESRCPKSKRSPYCQRFDHRQSYNSNHNCNYNYHHNYNCYYN